MYMIWIIFLILNLIVFVILILNYLIVNYNFNLREKSSSFECGFELIENSRLPFSIHFYLISVLFLIFDVEIVLLFPLIESLKYLSFFFWMFSCLMIMMILYLGLEFEKHEGVLKWFL
uniref:NADH-ubiquinone oxidoreductase chain 3 n=1 Tax=Cardiochiles fuscipennis TaxID=69312 RepID=A0A0A6ZKV1_9HYME|nr:NADH dehydrogenase subunit 3 [Cardiochiles fuscipennis]